MSHAKSVPHHKDEATLDQGYWNDTIKRRNETIRRISGLILIMACVVTIFATWLVAQYIDDARAMAMAKVARPHFFIRLVGVEGLSPGTSSPVPPVFHLAIDADGVSQCYHSCNGGKNSMLRISYHDMILAWGHVPSFCIDGDRSVATVDAKVEAAVLREEVRGLIQSEQHVVGKAEFDVEGEVAGLGYLHCKAVLLQGNDKESKAPCQVEYY
ncbi:unnamed protein product, partial [Urochloa humidicola]